MSDLIFCVNILFLSLIGFSCFKHPLASVSINAVLVLLIVVKCNCYHINWIYAYSRPFVRMSLNVKNNISLRNAWFLQLHACDRAWKSMLAISSFIVTCVPQTFSLSSSLSVKLFLGCFPIIVWNYFSSPDTCPLMCSIFVIICFPSHRLPVYAINNYFSALIFAGFY